MSKKWFIVCPLGCVTTTYEDLNYALKIAKHPCHRHGLDQAVIDIPAFRRYRDDLEQSFKEFDPEVIGIRLEDGWYRPFFMTDFLIFDVDGKKRKLQMEERKRKMEEREAKRQEYYRDRIRMILEDQNRQSTLEQLMENFDAEEIRVLLKGVVSHA